MVTTGILIGDSGGGSSQKSAKKKKKTIPSFSTAAGGGLQLDTGARPQVSSPGRGKCQAGQRPLARGLDRSPGHRFRAGHLWLGLPGLAVGGQGSGFKFRVTVSVAPRPEDSEAKLGRGVGACELGVHRGRGRVCVHLVCEGRKGEVDGVGS